ncbi:DUF1254 domain-containing protein [Kitasatospora gansuensis]
MTAADPEALAAAAYVYGSPLVSGLTTVDRCARQGLGGLTGTGYNRFGHADRAVAAGSVNAAAVCSIAQLDLSGGPLVLDVPDTGGAYLVLQFVDAWTNNFAYLGRRATGTGAQRRLLVPPHWHGTPEPGLQVIECPTTVATVIGRTACEGPADLPRVRALQAGLTLSPLEPGGVYAGLPEPDPEVPEEFHFLEQLRLWAAQFPPAVPDVEYQQRFAPLGLLDAGVSPYRNPAPTWAAALAAGLAEGRRLVEQAGRPDPDRPGGEWTLNLHLFDYNLDHLGPGTLDDPQWRIPDRRAAHLTRAVAARAALWGSHAYEVVQATTSQDADGRPLTGARSYTLRFEEPPPVDACWSLTLDDATGHRSIGDRTPGLVYAPDGSLTLLLQYERPDDADHSANWLPVPAGSSAR